MEDIDVGLDALVGKIRKRSIHSIAIPPLGSGLGGLEWSEVKRRIEGVLSERGAGCREDGSQPESTQDDSGYKDPFLRFATGTLGSARPMLIQLPCARYEHTATPFDAGA